MTTPSSGTAGGTERRLPVSYRGGFNLLPYRRRDALRARRRCAVECLLAVLAGSVAATAWAGWETLARARTDAERAALEATLARFGRSLAEVRRLEDQVAQGRNRAALALELARPRMRLLELVETLSAGPVPGVALRQLKQTDRGVEMLASATDSAASADWMKDLARVHGVQSVDVIDLRLLSEGVAGDGNGAGKRPLEFAVRLRWDNSAARAERPASHPAQQRVDRADDRRGNR